MPGNGKWIDVSVPLYTGVVHWPGDPVPSFELISSIDRGADANVTLCRMTAHTGTHMDAPCHFLHGQAGIDRFPIEYGIGRARVIAVPEEVRIVGKAELEGRGIQRGERVILKTGNSRKRWDDRDFQPGFVALNASA
ncbi:MAG: cyclase family protein, partial [Bryobacteraceae bacterium]